MSLFEPKTCAQCAAKDATIAALSLSITQLREQAEGERQSQHELIKELLARLPGAMPPSLIAPVTMNRSDIEAGFQRIFDEEGFESVDIPAEG